MSWPHSIPEDLRKKLEIVMEYRAYAPIDIWAAVKEWLDHHEVPAPDKLPEPQRPKPTLDQ